MIFRLWTRWKLNQKWEYPTFKLNLPRHP